MCPPNFGDEVNECDIHDFIHGHGVICMTLLSKQIHLHDLRVRVADVYGYQSESWASAAGMLVSTR